MKKLLLAGALIGLSIIQLNSMDQAAKIYYITAKMNLDQIAKNAEEGDVNSALALYDFNQSIKDPNYKITCEPSIKVLKNWNLIDDNNTIHSAIKDAFKQFNKLQ